MFTFRVRLHQASASMLRQLCDDACDSVLIEINGITPEWVCNPFSSGSTVFNENRIASVIAVLMLMLGINGPLRPDCYVYYQCCRIVTGKRISLLDFLVEMINIYCP